MTVRKRVCMRVVLRNMQVDYRALFYSIECTYRTSPTVVCYVFVAIGCIAAT